MTSVKLKKKKKQPFSSMLRISTVINCRLIHFSLNVSREKNSNPPVGNHYFCQVSDFGRFYILPFLTSLILSSTLKPKKVGFRKLSECLVFIKGAMSHTAHVREEALHLENVRQLFQVD